MGVLRIKGNLENLLKYGFTDLYYIDKVVFVKDLKNGNGYRISNHDGGIIHFNQNSVHNELDDTIYNLIKDGLVEICKKK